MPVKYVSFLVCVLTGGLLATRSWADDAAYEGVVNLRAQGRGFVVKHHHDWSSATQSARFTMITTHQDPFRKDNNYAFVAWYARDDGELLRRIPSPALTWLGVSPDSRYVIGLSNVMLDNPIQLVVYGPAGELLLKRHIEPEVSCLTEARYRELKRRFADRFRFLGDRVWKSGAVVYVDFMSMDMPKRLGPLWDALIRTSCPSPLSPNFSSSVTNWINWYDEADPAPHVIEKDGQPVALALRDPKGKTFNVPFRLDVPAEK